MVFVVCILVSILILFNYPWFNCLCIEGVENKGLSWPVSRALGLSSHAVATLWLRLVTSYFALPALETTTTPFWHGFGLVLVF